MYIYLHVSRLWNQFLTGSHPGSMPHIQYCKTIASERCDASKIKFEIMIESCPRRHQVLDYRGQSRARCHVQYSFATFTIEDAIHCPLIGGAASVFFNFSAVSFTTACTNVLLVLTLCSTALTTSGIVLLSASLVPRGV